jgi:group II intron reverse transcriptase/maturase
MGGRNMKVIVRVIRGRNAGSSFELTRLPAVIGRGSDCDVKLADDPERPTISRHHATLAWIENQILLIDHSTNGTEINGRWIENGESVVIDANEVIRVGQDTWLGIQVIAPSEEKATIAIHRRKIPVQTPPPAPTKGSLFEQLCDRKTLEKAWKRASLNRGGPGIDNVTVDDFAANADKNLRQLENELRSGRYQPMPLRIFAVPKPSGGTRRISIPTVRDRIVNYALLNVLTPLFEPIFAPCSFAYRPGRSAHDAIRKTLNLIRSGFEWILDADIASFFDTVSHAHLIEILSDVIKDEEIMKIIRRWLSIAGTGPGIGIPQGAPSSPLFANAYLNGFDWHMLNQGYNIVRYADDFVCIEISRAQAQKALLEAERYLRDKLALQLKPEKTRIVSLTDGFIFLGFRFDISGAAPAQEAYELLAKKLSDVPTQDPHYEQIQRGWERYFGPIDEDKISDIPDIRGRFIELFRGREDVHARQWINRKGKVGYSPINKEITDDDIGQHLAGDITLALYMHRNDNTVGFTVIDIDGEKEGDRETAMEIGFQIRQIAYGFGIPVYLEDSGQKGCHCWIFFSDPIPAGLARKLGMLLVARVQPLPRKVVAEVFPRHEKLGDDALGPLMKLPYGIHKATGRRCMFLDREGNPMELSDFLRFVKPLSVDDVEKAISRLKTEPLSKRELPKAPEDVKAVLKECGMLRRLCEKPALTGHLTHTERLILLYTLGRLGESGRRFLHEVIGLCDNYDPAITQQWLDRLDPEKPPISCARIRDWISEIEPGWKCDCQGTPELEGYKTPLAFAKKRAQDEAAEEKERKKRKGRLHAEDGDEIKNIYADEEEVWKDIAEDLFSDEG